MRSNEPDPLDPDDAAAGIHAAPPRDDQCLRILLLCNYDIMNAATVCDHVNSFVRYSKHNFTVLSRIGQLPDGIDLATFDVIVVHYSLTLALESYVPEQTKHKLAAFSGLKILFIQDEYRFVDQTCEALRRCKFRLVFTVLPEDLIPKIYKPKDVPEIRFVPTLTGYVPEWLKAYKTIPLSDRRIDLGYRGRTYPAWHGQPSIDRIEIGRFFHRNSRSLGLRTDIKWKEKDRIYGAAWVRFTQQCRAVLSTESRIEVIDRHGSISNNYDAFVDLLGVRSPYDHPNRSSMRRLAQGSAEAPHLWFNEMRRRFFATEEGAMAIAVISPRVFEAAALRTLLVMYEGEYSGALKPWRHYIPIKKDHSNAKEISDCIKDDVRVAEIVSSCYAEVACNPELSARNFISRFDKIIEDEMPHCELSSVPKHDKVDFYKNNPFYMFDNPYGIEVSKPRTMLSRIKEAASLGRQAAKRILR